MPTGSLTIDRENGETAASLNAFFVTTVNTANGQMTTDERTCDDGKTFSDSALKEIEAISAGIETLEDVIAAVAYIAKFKTWCNQSNSPADQLNLEETVNPNWVAPKRATEAATAETMLGALEKWENISAGKNLVNSSQNANWIAEQVTQNFQRESGIAAAILIDQAIASKNTIRDLIFGNTTGPMSSRLQNQWQQGSGMIVGGSMAFKNLSNNPVFTQTAIQPLALGFNGGAGTIQSLQTSRQPNMANVQPLSYSGGGRQINPLSGGGGVTLRQVGGGMSKAIASQVSLASAGSTGSFARGMNWANGGMAVRLGNNLQPLTQQFSTMSLSLTAGTGTTITWTESSITRGNYTNALLPLNTSAFEDFASSGVVGSTYGWSLGVSTGATETFGGMGYQQWNWSESTRKKSAIEIFEYGFPAGVKPVRVTGGSGGSGLSENTVDLSSQFNGSNQDFTLPEVYLSGSLRAYWNGQRLTNGDIVIETGRDPSSTFRLTIIGATSDVLLVDYTPLTS